jgi:hypothetical protein
VLHGIEAQLDQPERVRVWQCLDLLLELLLDYHIDPFGVYFLGVRFAVAGGIFALHTMVLEDVRLG